MKMLVVKLVHHGFWIGIIFIEDVLAFTIPPEPILDNVVHRQVEITVSLCNSNNLFLRLVAVLRLPESIRPFAKHRRYPGQLAIAGNDFVELGAVNEVVINRVGDFGTDIKRMNETVVEPR